MNKNLIIIFLIGIISTINAQNIVVNTLEKSSTISTKQSLFLDFKFAENIKVEQWNKNEVLVKADYTISNGEGNKDFSIKTKSTSSQLKIYSDFGDYFTNKRKRNIIYTSNCDNITKVNYTIYLPKNIDLTVKSISGSLEIDEFTGNLTTDLISGNVIIKKYNGELQLKTISGDLDVVITKARVKAKTLTGTIYSNLNIDLDKNSNAHNAHSKISGIVNNGNTQVSFNTISGNVYMRKL